MATLTVYPEANPATTAGWAGLQEGTGGDPYTWAAIHDAANADSTDTSSVAWEIGLRCSTTTSDRWRFLARFITQFDTSALTSGVTINSATYSLYVTGKTTTLGNLNYRVVTNTASATSFGSADYQSLGTTGQATDGTPGGTGAYWDVALNATGLSNINKTGVTKLGLRLAADADDSPPTWTAVGDKCSIVVSTSNESGTSQDPKLVIDYTAGGAGPTTVKTWDGVTQSTGIKTYLDVTVANTKSVIGAT